MASSSQHVTELLCSLKKLFASGVYTDLKIVCGNDQHQVHKAIVCLRSGRLAQLCSELGPTQEATITIPDDDPQTIDLMLQYLYTLEYSPRIAAPPAAIPAAKPLTNGVNGVNGHHDATPSPKTPASNGGVAATGATNGALPPQQQQQQQKPPQPPGTTLEYNIEREAFEAVPATEAASSKPSKKAVKKKKRSGTVLADTIDAVASLNASTTSVPVPEPSVGTTASTPSTTTTANAAAQTVPPAAITKPAPAPGPVTTPPSAPQPHSLLQHARLYTLAQKYGVPGLRALSASRFAAEAEEYWSSEDFLAAAVEAYNNTSSTASPTPTPTSKQLPVGIVAPPTAVPAKVDDADDEEETEEEANTRTIRDVVLSNMKAHPELLDRAAVREAIRVNAELSFDLMMYFRDNQQSGGGSASSDVSVQSGGRYY
ncbi:hypothetical protein PG994_004867 [Apiospora phragmitis]|uniref:BTB domain-containing protein n=1 Tax=Apiospora phragmitis TaxID=2905665 RepID=A0ABR1VVU4_9PEZI